MNYQSQLWQQREDDSIAHGALTNSKRPESFVKNVYPTHIKHANKCYLTTVDDERYIDLICGLGTNYYGYGNQEITNAVGMMMKSGGSVYSLSSKQEVAFAERMKGTFPFLERVRFLKSGSEGCSAAVRIARAFTGRDRVYQQGYSGWHDQFVGLTPPAKGVPTPQYEDGHMFKLEGFYDSCAAAYILEPIITELSDERKEFLNSLREHCTKTGAILIFDETITAVRYKNRSVAQTYNILPDLWVAGKALCGGLPMSVVGGRADIMEADYFVSSTWAGDRLACAAGLAACDLSDTTFKSEDLWAAGEIFMEEFNALDENVQLVGYPTRGIFQYKNETFKALFMQEMCKAKILIGPSWFYNKWLNVEKDNIVSVARAVIKKILDQRCRLEGKPPKSPFAQKVRHG
jgi:glutamate-1-semialdehyde aminotransferase